MNGKPTWNTRVMGFAACGGKLYASVYADHRRAHGWAKSQLADILPVTGARSSLRSSGFRGLTCVPNLNGAGSMLIAALEGPGDIYDIPLDGSSRPSS